jgi:hypothetical protein
MYKDLNKIKENTSKQLNEFKQNTSKWLTLTRKTMQDMKEEFNKDIGILKKSN